MSWLSVSFEVAADDVEAISDALLEAGAASVEVADAEAGSSFEQPVFAEPGSGDPRPWRRSVVNALVAEGTDAGALVRDSCTRVGMLLRLPALAVRNRLGGAPQDQVRADSG